MNHFGTYEKAVMERPSAPPPQQQQQQQQHDSLDQNDGMAPESIPPHPTTAPKEQLPVMLGGNLRNEPVIDVMNKKETSTDDNTNVQVVNQDTDLLSTDVNKEHATSKLPSQQQQQQQQTSLEYHVTGDLLVQDDHKKRPRRTHSLSSNQHLRTRTQRKQEQQQPQHVDSRPSLVAKSNDIPRTTQTRAAASKKDTTTPIPSLRNDSERSNLPHHHRQQRHQQQQQQQHRSKSSSSSISSRKNKMIPKKLSSRSLHPSTPMTTPEDGNELPTSDSVATTTPASNSKLLSSRSLLNNIDHYRITNPLITDYNEVLHPEPTSSKVLSLEQIQHITNGISFAIPDTYSIRYMAQLLGLNDIFQDLMSGTMTAKSSGTSSNGKVSMDQLQRVLLERSHSKHREENQVVGVGKNDADPIYNIPPILTPFASNPRINFWTTNTKEELDLLFESANVMQMQEQQRTRPNTAPNQSNSSKKQNPQSRSLLLDPFYVHLWQSYSTMGNSHKALQRIPISAVQHAKIFLQNNSSVSSSSGVAVAVAAATNTTTFTTTKVQESNSTDVDDASKVAPTRGGTNQNETSLPVTSSDLDNAAANEKASDMPSTLASVAVPLASSPNMDTVLKERFVISPQQQDVLQYVLKHANSTLVCQRYIFLPLEHAMEKYSEEVAALILTMNAGSARTPSCGVQTGWVAIDATTNESLPTTTRETDEEFGNMFTSSLGKVVGLILYQLEWCAFAESLETSAEMIVHVLGVHVGDARSFNAVSAASHNHQSVGSQPPVVTIEGRRLFHSYQPTMMNEKEAKWLRLVLLSLVFEHARRLNVWYAMIKPPRTKTLTEDRLFFEVFFNMVPARYDTNVLICDLHNTTVRYTFLQYQDTEQSQRNYIRKDSLEAKSSNVVHQSPVGVSLSGKQRWLLHLPSADDVQSYLSSSHSFEILDDVTAANAFDVTQNESISTQTSTHQVKSIKSGFVFSNPSHCKKGIQVALSVDLGENGLDEMAIYKLNVVDSTIGSKITTPSYYKDPPSLRIMRNFPLLSTNRTNENPPSEASGEPKAYPILSELMSKQNDLQEIEASLEPTLYNLLHEVVLDRLAYDNPDRMAKQNEEIRILQESEQLRERRIEQDLALQKRLEQDMDAVCEICLDGEVTPDNQILFCELCNVAVHQMCYGIDRVPDGDYYCIPCRRREYDNENQSGNVKADTSPRPICCELCPLRNGAFVRTDVPPKSTDPQDKFVHVLCAKWQGLNHVGNNKELVEDVTNIRQEFRRHRVKCDLCLGERGGMIKCAASTACKKWFHVTCARAVGTMKVIHGENCYGDVEEKAWNLYCPGHSGIATEDIPDNAVPVEVLIQAAKEFPPEEIPPPANTQFISLTGPERRLLLSDHSYEQALIKELLRNKYYGVRCEICDLFDDDSKTWTRCGSCNVIFCRFCKIDSDEVKGSYKCASCRYVEQKRKAKESYEDPTCYTCVQVGGLLREAHATPYISKFKKTPQYKESLYAKQTWVHSLCAIWLPDIELTRDIGTVDLTPVVCISNKSTHLIHHKRRCYVCGQQKGLKMHCDISRCTCNIDGQQEKLVVHVTCARQAGLEVRVDDERTNKKDGPLPYVRCYRHCSNEFNIRAKLEDLIEIEKMRAGKEFSKADAPMKLSEASRLLYSAIQVMRIFGWAWRWAEWWVDYNSSWEPLLEPGQKEKDMTKEELKIVESTRESRCEDARRCRLAAFGAALRNRLYDTPDGFKRTALDKALRAILSTTSLVGPLTPLEIDFYIDWLGRAYRSKSRLLYMGKFKNSISSDATFCIHEDGTPKYELGNRPLPGDHDLPNHVIFETDCKEIDSFLRDEVLVDDEIMSEELPSKPKSKKSSTKLKCKSTAATKKKSQTTATCTFTPSKRSTREKPETLTVDTALVSTIEGKVRRSVLYRRNEAREQISTDIKKNSRSQRSTYAEDIPDSLVHVAGLSIDDGTEFATTVNIHSNPVENAGPRPDVVNIEDSAAIGHTDAIPASELTTVDKEAHEKSPEEPSDLPSSEKELTDIIIDVAGDTLYAKPTASNLQTITDESPVVTNWALPQQSSKDVPIAEANISAMKRKREPIRPFTYEHHEMKRAKKSKNEARTDIDIPNKKRRPRLSQEAAKLDTSEHTVVAKLDTSEQTVVDGEPTIPTMAEPPVEPAAITDELSNFIPNTLSEETITEDVSPILTNVVKCKDTTAIGNTDAIQASEMLLVASCEKSPDEPDDLATTESGSTNVVLDMTGDPLDAKPIASKLQPAENESRVGTSQILLKQRAKDVPIADADASVKKRKREPIRPFTYEHHEMKGAKNKFFKNKEVPDIDVPQKKRGRPRFNRESAKLGTAKNTAVGGDPIVLTMPEPPVVYADVNDEAPNTSIEKTTNEPLIPTLPNVVKHNDATAISNTDAIRLDNKNNEGCKKSPEERSVLSLSENVSTDLRTDGTLDIDTKPIASNIQPAENESPVRTRRVPRSKDVPLTDAYASVKKRKREPIRPFTYGHHEMKGAKNKKSKNEAVPDIDIPQKKRGRPKFNRETVKIDESEHAAVDGEPNIPTMPEPPVMSNTLPSTLSERSTDTAVIPTETNAALVKVQIHDNVIGTDGTIISTLPALNSDDGNNNNSTEPLSVVAPRVSYAKIRRPGRPRKHKPPI